MASTPPPSTPTPPPALNSPTLPVRGWGLVALHMLKHDHSSTFTFYSLIPSLSPFLYFTLPACLPLLLTSPLISLSSTSLPPPPLSLPPSSSSSSSSSLSLPPFPSFLSASYLPPPPPLSLLSLLLLLLLPSLPPSQAGDRAFLEELLVYLRQQRRQLRNAGIDSSSIPASFALCWTRNSRDAGSSVVL